MRWTKGRVVACVMGLAGVALAVVLNAADGAESARGASSSISSAATRGSTLNPGVSDKDDRRDQRGAPQGSPSEAAHSKDARPDSRAASKAQGTPLAPTERGTRSPGENDPWEIAQQAATHQGDRLHATQATPQREAIWGDSKTDGEWLRVKIPLDDEDEVTEHAEVYPVVMTDDGEPHPDYAPATFAQRLDGSDPFYNEFDEVLYESLGEFDSEWPQESIAVTIELWAEKNPIVVAALGEMLAEDVPDFDAAAFPTTRAFAFELARYLIADRPELPEVIAMAQWVSDSFQLGGLMSMYVATFAYRLSESHDD